MFIKLNKIRAFSLIEVILSISILAILYSYSFNQLHSLYYKLNQRLYLSKIKYLIELSQAKSFHGKKISVLIDKNIMKMFANNILEKTLIISKKYQITHENIKDNIIDFYPSGVQTPFTIELKSKFYNCILITSLRGRIRSECNKV